MDIYFDHLEEMRAADRTLFLEAIARDDDLRREYAIWSLLADRVRGRQSKTLPERRLLVLEALRRAGRDSVLSDSERSELAARWPAIERDLGGVPFLDDVLRRIGREAADFDGSWALREKHLVPYRARTSRRQESRLVRPAWRVAAVAAVVVFVGILLFVSRRDSGRVEVAVPAGSIQQVALVDGSTVRLIGPASLSYRGREMYATRPERVQLSGDAYFDIVASDVPFGVESSTAVITVLGTSFGIRSHPERTEVVVATGRVSVAARGRADTGTVVAAGQSCVVLKGDTPSSLVSVDLVEALGWANLFVFQGTPVSEITEVLSRHYHVTVRVNASLESRKITGTFRHDQTLREILDVLATALGASVEEHNGGFLLSPVT